MYSQNNEEEIILRELSGITGKFVEIGAYDPFTFSNTRRLVELGWAGVYVEPASPCYKKFVNEYGEENPRIKLVNKAIGSSNGKLKFYESADAVSTSSDAWKTLWEKGSKVKFTETVVDMITGKTLFDEYGANVDFINIDTEATNVEVLNSIPVEYIKASKLVCIEHQNELEYIRKYFTSIGFKEVLYNGENLIFSKA